MGLVGSGGGLGHLGIQFAKALGLRVVGIDARDEGLELTRKFGADAAIDARKGTEEIINEVEKVTGGLRCHATVNISDAQTAAATACAITMMHGRLVQIAQVRYSCRSVSGVDQSALLTRHSRIKFAFRWLS